MLPLTVPLVAVIVALPAASAVTNPVLDTEAMEGALLLQVTGAVMMFPLASLSTAVACVDWPPPSNVEAAVTVTEDTTDDVTTSVALAVFPSTVPEIDTVPVPAAVTTPRFDTVARLVFELFQVTGRPVSTLPEASVATAVACAVAPTGMVDLSRTTLTFAT